MMLQKPRHAGTAKTMHLTLKTCLKVHTCRDGIANPDDVVLHVLEIERSWNGEHITEAFQLVMGVPK